MSKQISGQDARQGKPGRVRFILMISLALAVVGLAVVFFVMN